MSDPSDPVPPGDPAPARGDETAGAARPAGGGDAAIRASDAEREQAVERLSGAAGEGRLTLEELADRVEAASTARTRGELDAVLRDLPVPAGPPAPAPAGPPAPAPAGPPAPAPGGAAGPAAGSERTGPGEPPASAAPALRSAAVFGDLKRSGVWRVPVLSRWASVFGDVKLDLREAHVPGGPVEVEAATVFGDVELLVPEGVVVDVRARVFFGDVRQDAGGDAPPGAPRIVLTGWSVFGDVRILERRLRERLADRWRWRGAA
jgi:uncharacterized protein DUF1707/cell wall-active antibiotic response 4TMS protein YvqF